MNSSKTPTTSLKPFLLDGILSWCDVNGLTPILEIEQNDLNRLPMHLRQHDKLAFNMSTTAVNDKTITTDDVQFDTTFKGQAQPMRIVLSVHAWKCVRLKENGYIFDLSFMEQTQQTHAWFPTGIMLHQCPTQEVGLDVIEPPKPALRLVWDRDKMPAQAD